MIGWREVVRDRALHEGAGLAHFALALFLKEVAGSDHNFRLDEFSDTMRSRLVSVFSDALARD